MQLRSVSGEIDDVAAGTEIQSVGERCSIVTCAHNHRNGRNDGRGCSSAEPDRDPAFLPARFSCSGQVSDATSAPAKVAVPLAMPACSLGSAGSSLAHPQEVRA